VGGRFAPPDRCRLLQGFRDQAKKAMDGVKSQEYKMAKEAIAKAQERIDQARIEQIEKISETQSRQLTALEKARLQQLQAMQTTDKKALDSIVSTPFLELVNQDAEVNPFVGVEVETIIDTVVTPFCQAVCMEVDKVYSVNQKLMKLAAVCRKETLKHQKCIQEMEARLFELKRQAKQDSIDLSRLQTGVQLRNSQLRVIRDAYEKEVIAVKVQTANSITKSTGIDEIISSASRTFTSELLPDKIGIDAAGQDLDTLLSKYTSKLQEQLSKVPTEPPGGRQYDKRGQPVEDEGFDMQVRLMKIENELAQQQIKNMILRQVPFGHAAMRAPLNRCVD
jgi:hypothetical protein